LRDIVMETRRIFSQENSEAIAEQSDPLQSQPEPKAEPRVKLLMLQLLISISVVLCWNLLFDNGKEKNSWQEVYDERDGSVVEIYTLSMPGSSINLQSGTGFVFDLKGRPAIITCNHVVASQSNTLVRFSDKLEEAAEIVNASELHDLAIIQLPGINLSRYGAIPQGRSSDLRIGEEVMTIGHPISESHHISVGFYTGKFTDKSGRTLLRLSMAVDPGNSGGPVLNSKGQVIGIVSQKIEKSANIAFAIPVEKIQTLNPTR
jgi:S1-C subfamily serine protease